MRDGLRAVTAERVAFRFTMVEHDMGEAELVAEQRGPGEYCRGQRDGDVRHLAGRDDLRFADRADVRAVFSVPIGAGTAAMTARVLTAGRSR